MSAWFDLRSQTPLVLLASRPPSELHGPRDRGRPRTGCGRRSCRRSSAASKVPLVAVSEHLRRESAGVRSNRYQAIRAASHLATWLMLGGCGVPPTVEPVGVSSSGTRGYARPHVSDYQFVSVDQARQAVDEMDEAACEGLLGCGPGQLTMAFCRSLRSTREYAGVLPYRAAHMDRPRLSMANLRQCLERLRGQCPIVSLESDLSLDWLGLRPHDPCWAVFEADGDTHAGCASDLDCASDAYCAGPSTNECGQPTCRALRRLGESCAHSRQCGSDGRPVVCSGLPRLPDLSSRGTCQAVDVLPPGQRCGWHVGAAGVQLRRCPSGEACRQGGCVEVRRPTWSVRDVGNECLMPQQCDHSRQYDCVEGVCAPWSDHQGANCALHPCADGLVCRNASVSDLDAEVTFAYTCEAPLELGATCYRPGNFTRPLYMHPRQRHGSCASLCCGQEGVCIEPPALEH